MNSDNIFVLNLSVISNKSDCLWTIVQWLWHSGQNEVFRLTSSPVHIPSLAIFRSLFCYQLKKQKGHPFVSFSKNGKGVKIICYCLIELVGYQFGHFDACLTYFARNFSAPFDREQQQQNDSEVQKQNSFSKMRTFVSNRKFQDDVASDQGPDPVPRQYFPCKIMLSLF